MARVVINRAEAERESLADAYKLVRQVCYEVQSGAVARLATGPYTTGTLALSVRTDIRIRPGAVHGTVGSSLVYAASVHNGAEAHRIVARRARLLRFYWHKVGRVVFFPAVNHPGQPGKRYLTEPLRNSARRHNMRVIIIPR